MSNLSVVMVLFVFCLHKCEVLLQDDPYVGVRLQLVDNDQVHVDELSIFVAHSFGEAWVTPRSIEMLVPVQRHI